mmetsp:Transcript_142709/g.355731  ORF Transcript_142709/g.355731 Transcript_142709/m.355731 type:complete len:284 (-) Transcript_142709:160-1011(-)
MKSCVFVGFAAGTGGGGGLGGPGGFGFAGGDALAAALAAGAAGAGGTEGDAPAMALAAGAAGGAACLGGDADGPSARWNSAMILFLLSSRVRSSNRPALPFTLTNTSPGCSCESGWPEFHFAACDPAVILDSTRSLFFSRACGSQMKPHCSLVELRSSATPMLPSATVTSGGGLAAGGAASAVEEEETHGAPAASFLGSGASFLGSGASADAVSSRLHGTGSPSAFEASSDRSAVSWLPVPRLVDFPADDGLDDSGVPSAEDSVFAVVGSAAAAAAAAAAAVF